MVDKFAVACYGLIFNGRNLLMVRQQSGLWANKWTLPGGLLNTGDCLESCVEREVFVRTSCRVKAKRQIMAIPYNISGSVFERNILIVFFLCDLIERPIGDKEEGLVEWVDRESFYQRYRDGKIPVQALNVVSIACPDSTEAWQLSDELSDPGPVVNGVKLIQSISKTRGKAKI